MDWDNLNMDTEKLQSQSQLYALNKRPSSVHHDERLPEM